VQSGRLRHRVTIEAKTEVEGPYGDPVETWAPEAERWADITPLAMREVLAAGQIDAQLTHRVVLRYYPGLTGEHRLVHDGRVFHIYAVRNVGERDRTTEILATEETT
jgi:SPP1 family predicted phage head-tail adaptor